MFDLPAWWAQPGRPGASVPLDLALAPPWTLAGHALGAWSVSEPLRAPFEMPFPGVRASATPIAWYDSVRVATLGNAAWSGYRGALVTVTGETRDPFARHASAVVDLRSGDYGLDENALTIQRGDSLRWMRGETMSGTRGTVLGTDLSGHHAWGGAAALRRGRHQVEATFAQRGSAAHLSGGEEEAVRGESGSLGYRQRRDAWEAGITLSRGIARHESFGDEFNGLEYSIRLAQETAAAADFAAPLLGGRFGARAEWTRSEAKRFGADAFERSAQSVWSAVRLERAAGAGRLTLDLGAGRHSQIDRLDVAPGVGYSIRRARYGARVAFERVVVPVWSDLAAGEDPFLQSTWAGVIEADAHPGGFDAKASLLAGRTRDRAIVARLPLEELWMRAGAVADREPTTFALAMLSGRWAWRNASAGGEGFLLQRTLHEDEPRLDPRIGATAWVGARFAFFQGDLGIGVRGEFDGVGSRESDSAVPLYLPGYVSAGASIHITLADAIITVRARNLEDKPRPDVWIDSATGEEALGPGRELRFSLTLPLRN